MGARRCNAAGDARCGLWSGATLTPQPKAKGSTQMPAQSGARGQLAVRKYTQAQVGKRKRGRVGVGHDVYVIARAIPLGKPVAQGQMHRATLLATGDRLDRCPFCEGWKHRLTTGLAAALDSHAGDKQDKYLNYIIS